LTASEQIVSIVLDISGMSAPEPPVLGHWGGSGLLFTWEGPGEPYYGGIKGRWYRYNGDPRRRYRLLAMWSLTDRELILLWTW
jgi:hypothetical protein